MLKDDILKYINHNNGTYIEIGGFDGVFQSNTIFLEEEYNWTGVLIEPSPDKFKEMCINRKNNILYNCACVSFNYNSDVICGDFNGRVSSSVEGRRRNNPLKITVNAKNMTQLLDDSGFNKFDFLSLDVEGYELAVLKGIDFIKYPITWLLIEVYEKDKLEIFDYIHNSNYSLICNLSGYNKKDNPGWDGTHNDYLFKIK